MPRIKYYYDKQSMEYRKIPNRLVARNTILFVLASFLFGFLCVIILLNSPVLKMPRELAQEREIKQYKLQFDILNEKLAQLESVISNVEERDNNIYRVFFDIPPIPKSERKSGFGGINRYKHLEGFNNSEIIKEVTKKLEILQKETIIQSKSLDEILNLAKDKEDFLESIPAIQPVENKNLKRVASGYGRRTDPFTKVKKMHWGMDFVAVKGTPVYATGNGVVIRVDSRAAGYGNHIRIRHKGGYISLYAHLSKFNVKKGQKVKRGEVIGFVGSTGRSEGPHIHYEVRKGLKRINPLNFYYGELTTKEFDEIVKIASDENQSFD